MRLPDTIQVVGYLHHQLGLGESARGLLIGAEAAGFRTIGKPASSKQHPLLAEHVRPQDLHRPGRTLRLLYMNAPSARAEMARSSLVELARPTATLWWWETERLPQSWVSIANRLRIPVWAGSTFVAKAISESLNLDEAVPVVRPLVMSSSDDHKPEEPVVLRFYFCFDYFSEVSRKNPAAVVKAFRAAFPTSDDVELVIRTTNEQWAPDEGENLRRECQGDPRVKLIDQNLSRDDTLRWLRECHCFVSLHKSEGFGLSIAEAMSMGTPVITTAYGGNLDYMRPGDLLVPAETVEEQVPSGAYAGIQRWARPDLDVAVDMMRSLRENYAMYAARAAGRAEEIRQQFGPEAVGSDLKRAIELSDFDMNARRAAAIAREMAARPTRRVRRLVKRSHG